MAASLSVARIDASLDCVVEGGNILLINQLDKSSSMAAAAAIPSDSEEAAIPPNAYRVLLTGFGV